MDVDGDKDFNHKGADLDQQTATSAKTHVDLVKSIIDSSQNLLGQYFKEVESLKQELSSMKLQISQNNQDISDQTQPTLTALLRDLRQAITNQREENAQLQTQITELQQQKSQIQQLIISCVQQLQQLEEQVGHYA